VTHAGTNTSGIETGVVDRVPRETMCQARRQFLAERHTTANISTASKWDTAWRALGDAAGLPGLRFHHLRHTVVTRLLEAGEPDHVVESITGHLSRRSKDYSHIRIKAKKAALDRPDGPGAKSSIKIPN
jgi:integrase